MNNNPPNPTPSVTEELKPCPFCSGPAKWQEDDGVCGVPFGLIVDHDRDCWLKDPKFAIAQAIAAWNTRPDQPPSDDAVERHNTPDNEHPSSSAGLTDVERVKDAIWSARQDAPNEAYALKMRLSYDEAMRAARAAIVAMQQPIHADEVERAALASLTERFGARAAEYQREFDTSAWREELRVIRAALIVSDMSGVEMREALKPFAECADSYAETQPDQRQVIEHEPGIRTINLGDLRRARAALNPGKDEQ